MPLSLSREFVHSREYPIVENEYVDGTSQRAALASNSRKRWQLGKRLTPSALQTLRDFYEARGGMHEAFYFYDPYEANPKFSHDPTGVAVQGRYTVRFNSAWHQSVTPGRADVQIELIELA
jgi:phage-related protein